MEMMEVMRKENEERAEEFRKTREEFIAESVRAREMMEESIRMQEQLQRRNEEFQR